MIPRSHSRQFLTRILRVFFYLLYHPMAWSYDLVAAFVSLGKWGNWVRSVLPYINGPYILEIGHGPGHLQKALQKQGFTVFGVDSSRQMSRQAKVRLLKESFTPHLTSAYAQNLPFYDQVFDQVVATFPTEYIYSPKTLDEVYRTLKPNGTLVVLPFAWITGTKLLDRSAATLFQITGQSPDWDLTWLTPFVNAGFETDFDMINHKSWSLVIITALKPSNEKRTLSTT